MTEANLKAQDTPGALGRLQRAYGSSLISKHVENLLRGIRKPDIGEVGGGIFLLGNALAAVSGWEHANNPRFVVSIAGMIGSLHLLLCCRKAAPAEVAEARTVWQRLARPVKHPYDAMSALAIGIGAGLIAAGSGMFGDDTMRVGEMARGALMMGARSYALAVNELTDTARGKLKRVIDTGREHESPLGRFKARRAQVELAFRERLRPMMVSNMANYPSIALGFIGGMEGNDPWAVAAMSAFSVGSGVLFFARKNKMNAEQGSRPALPHAVNSVAEQRHRP